jgi:phosphoesterase RecJ-like protein
MKSSQANRFSRMVEAAQVIAIVTHKKPDGDALGSALGLGHALETQGKTVAYVCADPVPAHYRFLPGFERFTGQLPAGMELLLLLDCGRDHMSGFDIAGLGVPVVEIDHHLKPADHPTDRLGIYDTQAASTAEIVYGLLRQLHWPVTRESATSLLTGLVTDTSAFQNGNTTAETFRNAAGLLRRGARLKEVIKHCFYTSTIPKLRLWGLAMARIEQNAKVAGIVSTVITREDIAECGAHPDDVEGLVNFLNAIPGVPALMLLTDPQPGIVKGSLRTRQPSIDVNRLAQSLGGGGHRQAAGFTVPGVLTRNIDDSWEVRAPGTQISVSN